MALAAMATVVLLSASIAHASSPAEETAEEPTVHAVCPDAATGLAECMSYEVEPEAGEPALQGTGERGGFSPADLKSAYNLNTEAGKGLTVAIVDAFDDPNAESDLAVYRSKYGLPACTTANGCFKKVNQLGEEKNYPVANAGWGAEISLDLDMASAVCPQCKILLVESADNFFESLGTAENYAASLNPAAISNSWGNGEFEEQGALGSKYFNHPGVPITVSSGDGGYGAGFPASSPYVIAVGGTALMKDAGTRGWAEEAWIAGGSGCSAYEAKPKWQKDTPCGKRMISDVSAVADPATPLSVYDTYQAGGWLLFGGTSASAPIVAGLEALSSPTMRSQGAEAFYNGTARLFDVAAGTNGICTPPSEREYFCTAELGYDGPTGNGTPGRPANGTPSVSAHAGNIGPYEAKLSALVNPEGASTTYRFEYGSTTAYGEVLPVKEGSAGSGTANVTVSTTAYNLNAEHTYHFRIVATNSKGTTKGEDHTFITSSTSVPSQPTFSAKYGSRGSGPVEFKGAMGTAVIPTSGNVAVADIENNRIQILNSKGEYVRSIGEFGTGNGQLNSPISVTADSAGNIYVADRLNERIVKFSETGSFMNNFGTGKIGRPWDVAIDNQGNIWTAAVFNGKVTEINGSTGEVIRSFISGEEKGWGPTAITTDSAGNVWTTTGTHRVEEHSSTGAFIRKWGETGDRPGQFFSLRGIEIDPSGNIWVTNYDNEIVALEYVARVEVYNSAGKYLTSFGVRAEEEEEVEPSQMYTPWGLALDPRGNVWVADEGFSKVTKWTVPSPWPPTYASSVGSAGSGPGQFKAAMGVAVIPANGNLAVVDESDNRVEIFNPEGTFIRSIGEFGTGNGQLNSPISVAADPAGNIYVADRLNDRIEKFSETGAFLQVIGTGKLTRPWDVAVDASGNVWATDFTHNEVKEFSSAGALTRSFATGSGPGGIAIDPKGNVWTAVTTGPNQIEEHSATGTLIRKFGQVGSGDGQLSSPQGLAVDASGHVWVADRLNKRIEVFGENGEYITKFGSPGSGPGQFNQDYYLDVDARGSVWVSDVTNNKVSRLTVPSSWPPTYSGTIGSEGVAPGQFKEPMGAAVDPRNGNLAIADSANNRIEVFNASGELIRVFGETGSGNGQLSSPFSVAIDSAGYIYVADRLNNRIEKFTETGAFSQVIGAGKVTRPWDVAVDASGNVWATDFTHNEAKEFSSAGTLIRSFATGASPGGIAVDPKGNVWTTSISGSNGVEEHSSTGALIKAFGKPGTESGQLSYPVGIDTDASGNVWVADRSNHRIEVFSETGEYITKFGAYGTGAGQFQDAYCLALDPRGYIWAIDSTAGHVSKWIKK